MSLKDWLSTRMYVTAPIDKDPFFHPRAYQKTKAEVVAVVSEILKNCHNGSWKNIKRSKAGSASFVGPVPYLLPTTSIFISCRAMTVSLVWK